jgi:hypothetical protein
MSLYEYALRKHIDYLFASKWAMLGVCYADYCGIASYLALRVLSSESRQATLLSTPL